ncbi:hypothetical protein EVJ22_02950 [Exiguobacterium sp. SH0S7]|uniref:hypothetical protein n=1 Tax=Exiguobacterium sp. SH0S7 TaxID=2510951 RepID=UPI00103FA6F6|nr:hypothetical protein [Exiguobacterium sp. SH0S7]TCI73371.1 hypothetical protein EVJ22_02950 [Exiguobacterium sp. SH0S7]
MKRFWKWALAGIGILVVGMGGLFLAFNQSMQSDPDEEAKAIQLAEPYVAERFDNAELTTEVTFDNMGNFPFEYAATAVDSVTGTEFFVYADETTGEVVDTFLASKWEDDVTDVIEDSVMTAFGRDVTYDVFYDEVAVRQLDASAATPLAYKTADIVPTILVTIRREPASGDEALVRTWMTALKESDMLRHAEVHVDYVAKNGEILNDSTPLILSF